MHLQLLLLHTAYQFKVLLYLIPFGRKGGALNSPILEVGEVLGRWDLYQSKAHPRLPNTSHYKILLYLPPFGGNSNVKLWSQFAASPVLGLRVDLGVENGTNRNVVLTFLFDFCTHYWSILDRLATIHNATDGQSDLNRPPMLMHRWPNSNGRVV